MAERVAGKNRGITSSALKCIDKLLKKSDIPAEGHEASKQPLPLREDALLYYDTDYGSGPPPCCKTFLKKIECSYHQSSNLPAHPTPQYLLVSDLTGN